jgi:Tfp pilus assembly PilM family ATPase
MTRLEPIIGLHICPHEVRAVAVDSQNSAPTLHAIDEWPASFPDSVYDTADLAGPCRMLTGAVRVFLHKHRITTRRISIALDSSMVFLATLPATRGLDRGAMKEHLAWELSRFFPGVPSEDFVSDVHVMANSSAQDFDEIMAAGLRRPFAAGLEHALGKAGLALEVIDVDHFSADVALRENYPDAYSRYIALAGVKDRRLDVSLLRNGVLESYSYHTLDGKGQAVQIVAALSREVRGLASVMAYGPALDNELLLKMRHASLLVVEAFNPLRHVDVAESVQPADYLTSPSYRFAAAIGVALRRD